MKDQQNITTLVVSETFELSLEDMSAHCQLPVDVILELVELGLFETQTTTAVVRFDAENLSRIQMAARLFHDLNINAAGVVLALELLDEVNILRQEISILKRLTR